jgi:hypothetical protein
MRNRRFLLVGLLLLVLGCVRLVPISFAGETEEERTIRLSEKARNLYNLGMEKGDLSGYIDMWADDAVRTTPTGVTQGKEEVRKYYEEQIKNFKAKVIEKWRMVKGSTIVSVFLWDGVHRASGKRLTFDVVAIYEYNKEGKRQNVSYYYDTAKISKFMKEVSK